MPLNIASTRERLQSFDFSPLFIEELGWEPRTQLKEGLGRTIAYFEKLIAENDTKEILAR